MGGGYLVVYQLATFGNHQTVMTGSSPMASLVYFSNYFSFLLFFIYISDCTPFLFSELMIKKNSKQLCFKSRCFYDSWIRVVFAKVFMLSVIGEYTCALRASLLATWIYSEY